MAINLACSVTGDECSEPGGSIRKGMCTAHYIRHWRHGNPTAGNAPRGATTRFVQKAIAHSGDDCLVWPYGRTNGYGEARVGGKMVLVHRHVLIATQGPPPAAGLFACHKPGICHNRACVSPNHLYWGTAQDNQIDRVADDTHDRGERQWGAILTREQVRAIRKDVRPDREVALDYGCSVSNIRMIQRYESWAWLPDDPDADEAAA